MSLSRRCLCFVKLSCKIQIQKFQTIPNWKVLQIKNRLRIKLNIDFSEEEEEGKKPERKKERKSPGLKRKLKSMIVSHPRDTERLK